MVQLLSREHERQAISFMRRRDDDKHRRQVIQLLHAPDDVEDMSAWLDGIIGKKTVDAIARAQLERLGLPAGSDVQRLYRLVCGGDEQARDRLSPLLVRRGIDGKVGRNTWRALKKVWRKRLGLDGNDEGAATFDISKWSLDIDFPAARLDGMAGAYLKSSHGTDPLVPETKLQKRRRYWAERHSQQADAAGVPRGWYHWATPSSLANDPIEEAEAFLRIADLLGMGDMLPALDLEEGDEDTSHSDDLRGEALTRWCVAWLERVERAIGAPLILYSYGSFLNNGAVLPGYGLERFPLWIAHYGKGDPSQGTPSKWPLEIWQRFLMWQWTSSGDVQWDTGDKIDLNFVPDGLESLLISTYSAERQPCG